MEKKIILVIDDEQSFIDLITKTLKTSDYKVIQALNGEMGIQVAKKFIPDIIISDWEMPVMNGIDAIKKLKSDDLTKDIPVIMCTGEMTTPDNLNTALLAGAVDYIRKPIDPVELLARINSALKLASSYSEIKLKNREIMRQNSELKLLNATKDKFFKIISHDLKEPFNSILGYSDILHTHYDSFDDVEKYNCIKNINKSALFAFELLENLLTWAKSQTRGIRIIKETLNLKELVENSIAPYKLNASLKNIDIKLNIPPDISLHIDKNTSMTFIGNIVNNAIKFTPNGGLISIDSHDKDNFIEVCVIDSGVGIPPEKIEKLFRIDEGISTKGTNNEKGTGLGLVLCKEFIEKNNGCISVKSKEGKGSEFIISLPKNELS